MRSTRGDLLERISLELAGRPKIVGRPEVKSDATEETFRECCPLGGLVSRARRFHRIHLRFMRAGRARLRKGAKVRAVWVAESIGDDALGLQGGRSFDDRRKPTAHGAFTLSRPDEGWPPGDYRAEFYVDEALVETAKLKIVK